MRRANEARLYALTTATACMLALLAGVVGAPTRAVMQNLVFDQYQRWKPRPYAFDQPVRIVAIDDESLKRLGQWPWPRERLAELVETLKRAGAAAIAFDFLFAEKDRADANAATGETPDDCLRPRHRWRARRARQLRLRGAQWPRRVGQGGIRHRRRRRDEVPDALAGRARAFVRARPARGWRRFPQLAPGLRQGRAARAAHPQRGRRRCTQSRHGGFARRAGRLDLYRQVLERKRRNRLRGSVWRAGHSQRRIDDRYRSRGGHPGLFRASRPSALDPGMEGSRTGSGPQRVCAARSCSSARPQRCSRISSPRRCRRRCLASKPMRRSSSSSSAARR